MTRQSSILFQHSSKHLSAWQEIDAQFLLWSGLEYGLIWSLGILETCLQAAEFVNLSDNWASPALTQRTNSERCGKWTWGNFTRLREQHAPVGLADGFYTMQASYWERCRGTQASFEVTVEPMVTYPVSQITFHFWSKGCYISTLLLWTQHPAWGLGIGTATQRCSEYLFLPKKMKIFLVHKRSSYLETTTTSYQRGLVHFFKWSRELYDVSWFPLQRCSSQKMTVRVKMIMTKKAS